MSISPASLRLVCSSLWVVAVAGCQGKYEMVTAALDTVSVSEGLSTGFTSGETAGETAGEPTGGVPTTGSTTPGTTTNTTNTTNTSNTTMGGSDSGTTTSGGGTTADTAASSDTWDPSETTGPPAPCNGPEDCTGEGMGDFGPVVMPFFRGEVCLSDKLRPGDMLALSLNPCIHPCLDPGLYGWRYISRCNDVTGCEIAFMLYYDEAVGKNCPADVFHKFDPALCHYPGPHNALTQSLGGLGGQEDKVLIPFLTNEDTAAMLKEMPAQIWTRIDGHTQAADRYFVLDVDAAHPAPPTKCVKGDPGCTCKQVGF